MRSLIIALRLSVILTFFSCVESKDTSPALPSVPPDLEISLWAESPMLHNPTNIDVDSKGRLWITEAVNYRNFNNDSTTHLHHHSGDRIVILEDTDNDGQADRSKIFVQDKDLVSPLGIAVIGNKIYVSSSPNLIVYTDQNGDDIPDSKEILLTGFGGKDHDHSLHAVVGGPDGRIYFNCGNAGPHIVTDKSGWTLRSGSVYTGGSPYARFNTPNLKSDDGEVWVGGLALRMDADGKNLSVVAHNFRNSYEIAIDSRGDIWQNDNDDQVVACRTTWVTNGGNAGYFSNDGSRYWQADQRPGQDVFDAHWHQDDPGIMPAGDRTGAGAPTGIVVNESDLLGENYHGMLLSADAGRNVIFGYLPKIMGSGYSLGTRFNFVTTLDHDNNRYVWNDSSQHTDNRKWFRPSDVAVGTDGSIYISDWYDPVVGGHQMDDSLGFGRIYRLTPRGKNLRRPVLNMSTMEGLVEALQSPAANVRHDAYQRLIHKGDRILPYILPLLNHENEFVRSRSIWLFAAAGAKGKPTIEKLITHSDPMTRVVALRAMRANGYDIHAFASGLAADSSGFVRRELIAALSGEPYTKKRQILSLALPGLNAKDRWYVEAIGAAVKNHESDFMVAVEKCWNKENKPAREWGPEMTVLAWRLHPKEYVSAFKERALAIELPLEERIQSLTALAFIRDAAAVEAMMDIADKSKDEVGALGAYWLGFRQSNDWYELADWSTSDVNPEKERTIAMMKVRLSKILNELLPEDERRRNLEEMAADEIGGRMLLTAIMEKQLPSASIPHARRVLLSSRNEQLRLQASTYFGSQNSETVYSVSGIERLKQNVANGKNLFQKHCSGCHKVNSIGRDIGPELTLIGQKYDKQRLVEAITTPSAGIVFGYETWTITTLDGISHFGFIVGDGQDVLILKDLAGNKITIAADKIKSRTPFVKSIMPDAKAFNLSEQDLADLSGYLSTLK